MLLRAGLLSLALLLASRLLGLLRESVQAAVLGATGLADLAILLLTLPDQLTGILASGALAYVLLPLWSRQAATGRDATQARIGRWLLGSGALAGVLMAFGAGAVAALLAPGLPPQAQGMAGSALVWSAAALPLALLAALWATRLQHEHDFVGLYGSNVVVSLVVIPSLVLLPVIDRHEVPVSLAVLGLGLLLAMGLRLLWLRWRLRRLAERSAAEAGVGAGWPGPSVWLWALASAGLPLLLPLVARSLASQEGPGALTTFNYAWKLIELPLILAIQLVATLAFPGIARAFAEGAAADPVSGQDRRAVLRQAFVLAWTLACAATAALTLAAPGLAQLLFGWGRMTPEAVAQVAQWARIGAWSLLPQALLAVLLTLMASTGRLRGAALAYLAALALLCALGWWTPSSGGAWMMVTLDAALTLAAVALVWRERAFLRGVLHWRDGLPPLLLALLTLALPLAPAQDRLQGLGLALAGAGVLLAASWALAPGLRQALRR